MLSAYVSFLPSPQPAYGVQCNVQASKTNPNERVDLRAMVHNRNLARDSLNSLALHFWAKLCGINGAPFLWSEIVSGAWYASAAVSWRGVLVYIP